MVVRNDSLHLTYLDNDAIVAATLEPAAKKYVLNLRSTSYLALSATVIYEIAAAPPSKRRRLVETAIEVVEGYSTDQAPDVLREVLVRAPIPACTDRQLRGISGLEVLLQPDPPDADEFFGKRGFERIQGQSLADIMRDTGSAAPEEKDLPFKEFFFKRAKAHVMMLAEGAANRGHIERARFMDLEPLEIIQRKQMFAVVATMLATMYRALQRKARGKHGCISDLRTVIETAHADAFLTRDKELIACNELVREAFPQFPMRVVRLPSA
jgi:hypothetical protein